MLFLPARIDLLYNHSDAQMITLSITYALLAADGDIEVGGITNRGCSGSGGVRCPERHPRAWSRLPASS
jgi:2C-methyl-D-erythritol 2,4-cyclodiphosphate synthase